MNRRARALLTAGGWLAAAAAATTVGVISISAAGSDIAGTTATPLSQDQVRKALASASEQTASPQPAASPSGPGVTRTLSTPGGSIIARCADGKAALLSWSPAQGYQTDDIQRGPARTATMKFESGDTEIRVSVTCPGGTPVLHASTETGDRHHR